MKYLTFILTAIFVFGLPLVAQDKQPDFQTVKTEKGMMVMNSNKAQSFVFLVAGKNPTGKQNEDGSLLIQTDSNGVLVYFIKTSAFLDQKQIKKPNEILYAHREQDIANQETALKARLNVDVQGFDILRIYNFSKGENAKQVIPSFYWSYIAPNSENSTRVFFQNVLVGDLVLMVGTMFDKAVKTEEVKASIKEVLETLTLLPPPRTTALKPKTTPKTPKKKTARP